MAMDPNKMYESLGLRRARESQNRRKSFVNQAVRTYGKNKVKGFGKALFKKMIRAIGTIIKKILAKLITVIVTSAGVLLIKLLGIVLIAGIISLVSFYAFSFLKAGDLDYTEVEYDAIGDREWIEPILRKASKESIDISDPEQLIWATPPDLIMSFLSMISLSSDNETTKKTYEDAVIKINKLLKPSFEIETYDVYAKDYTITQYIDSSGYLVTDNIGPESSPYFYESVEKIAVVETWRGRYTYAYSKDWGGFAEISTSSETHDDGSMTITTTYQQIETFNYSISEQVDYLMFHMATSELDFYDQEEAFIQEVFNDTIDMNSAYYTQRTPISVDNRIEFIDYEPLPPELINGEYLWPVPTISRISSGFGNRTDPFTGKTKLHRGIDISIGGGKSGGHNIYAFADGVVTKAGSASGFGQAVYIQHDNGIETRYGHLQWDAYGVKVGDKVQIGDYIGQIGHGSVGSSTGAHLHFEVILNGVYRDPLEFIRPPK